MSVLTKVFVVLVTVLSIVLVALIVPFVANTQNYKNQLADAEARRIVAEQTAALRQNELNATQQQESKRLSAFKQENENLTSQINLLTQKLADSEAAAIKERTKNRRFEADLGRLTAANNQYAQITKELQAEVTQRRETMVDQQTRAIQLTDRNNELESQLEAMTRQVRRMREQLVQVQELNSQLETRLAQLPPEWKAKVVGDDAAAEPFVPETMIAGHVTMIDTSAEETFVQVNVGQNDGVEPNMKFLVHRENQFLATLVVTRVDAQDAVGRLELVDEDVVIGDGVITGGY